MDTKPSVSAEVIDAVDEHADRDNKKRSEAIRNARDQEILNRRAEFLNEEAFDVLAYQVQR